MRMIKHKLPRDEGWTFIEAILSVVIMTIMVLGLTIVMLAFKEHLDRSWAIRVMDQFGNDVVERLSHEMRNALDIELFNGPGETDAIDITYLDPNSLENTHIRRWRADLRNVKILIEGIPMDKTFPPKNPGRGETYEIVKFKLVGYGQDTPNHFELIDSRRRSETFLEATYEIIFTLRYSRAAIRPGENNWSYEKTYRNRVYVRNKNLVVKHGVTQ